MQQNGLIQTSIDFSARDLVERVALIEVDFANILAIGKPDPTLVDGLRENWPNATIEQFGEEQRQSALPVHRSNDADRAGHTSFELPFNSEAFDLVVSNLAATFYPPDQFAIEVLRVLKHTGVLMISVFGPDSFRQVKRAANGLEEFNFTAPFVDMRDFANVLYAGGFKNPVVDIEQHEHCYATFNTLVDDFERCEFVDQLVDQPGRLGDESVRNSLLKHYPQSEDKTDEFTLSLDIYFAIAWKIEAQTTSKQVQFTTR